MIVDSVMNFNCQPTLIQEGHDRSNGINLLGTYIAELRRLETREILCVSLLVQTQLSVVIRMLSHRILWEEAILQVTIYI